MKELKTKVRKHDQCLEQVINRYSELQNNVNPEQHNNLEQKFSKLEHIHQNGPVETNLTGTQYKCLKLEKFKVNVDSEKDCYILSKSGEVVKCMNIINTTHQGIIILGKVFNSVLPYYNKPMDSSIFNIFVVRNISDTLKHWILTDIKKKIMIIQHADQIIAIPLIHTEC